MEYRVDGFENRVTGVQHNIADIMYILCAMVMLIFAWTRDTSSIENSFEDVHNRVDRVESNFYGSASGVFDLKCRYQIDVFNTENLSKLKFTSFCWSSNMNIVYAYAFYRSPLNFW